MCKFLLIYINFSLSCVSFIHFFALLFTLWVGSFGYYYSLSFFYFYASTLLVIFLYFSVFMIVVIIFSFPVRTFLRHFFCGWSGHDEVSQFLLLLFLLLPYFCRLVFLEYYSWVIGSPLRTLNILFHSFCLARMLPRSLSYSLIWDSMIFSRCLKNPLFCILIIRL